MSYIAKENPSKEMLFSALISFIQKNLNISYSSYSLLLER
ncbi:hypothetical protein NEOC65_002397 [Neochlamydia sp. AcF65]|nr:hypothetical protein [Neochlamydia sp. AcF65]MBS4169704.1 hypothetical protein [Neochlamydia sp. AcF95]